MPAKTPSNQIPMHLFPDSGEENTQIEENNQSLLEHYKSVSKVYVPLRAEAPEVISTLDEETPTLVLPRRWEFCIKKAKELRVVQDLHSIVRPPSRALEELAGYIDLLKSNSGEGTLWIFNGEAGAGKTTFLQTLEYLVNQRQGKDILEVQVVTGREIELSNRLNTFSFFREKVLNRKSQEVVLVLVLEDVEQSLRDDELEGLSQALKMLLRSTDGASKNILFVIPVNNQKHGMRIRDAANEIGLSFRENSNNTLYIFESPKEEEYIEIVENLTRVLNGGRPLADFGVRREILEQIPKRRVTIGNFIQNVAETATSQQRRTVEILRESRYKKIVTIFSFVRPMHPTELYNAAQLVVSDRSNRLSSE